MTSYLNVTTIWVFDLKQPPSSDDEFPAIYAVKDAASALTCKWTDTSLDQSKINFVIKYKTSSSGPWITAPGYVVGSANVLLVYFWRNVHAFVFLFILHTSCLSSFFCQYSNWKLGGKIGTSVSIFLNSCISWLIHEYYIFWNVIISHPNPHFFFRNKNNHEYVHSIAKTTSEYTYFKLKSRASQHIIIFLEKTLFPRRTSCNCQGIKFFCTLQRPYLQNISMLLIMRVTPASQTNEKIWRSTKNMIS
jgi:hypothetical protein